MDLSKSGIIWKNFINGRSTEIFSWFLSTPSLWEPLKDSPPPRTVVGNRQPNCQWCTQLYLRPFLHPIVISMMLKGNLESIPYGSERFKPRMFLFFYLKRHKECSALLESARKGLHQPFDQCQHTSFSLSYDKYTQWIFSAPLAFRFLIANNCMRWRSKFKGL